jgi:ABC-type multidrug transport system ATPase subunit
MTALLELRQLSGGYSPIQIFQNVDLVVQPGETVGFFGPNDHGSSRPRAAAAAFATSTMTR